MKGTHQMLRSIRAAEALSRALLAAFTLSVAFLWAGEGAHAQTAWAELWLHRTVSPVVQTAVGDVDGDGLPELAVVVGSEVALYALGEEGPRFLASAGDLAQRPTAVAIADYDGDGAGEVWVGTASPGIVHVYRYAAPESRLEMVDRARYTWSDIRSLVPLDLDGWGKLDVAAGTAQGSLHLFRWTPDGYVEVRTGELGRAPVRQFEAADVDADGREELVIARGVDQVVVAGWRYTERAVQARRAVAEYEGALRRYLEEAGSGRAEFLWHLDHPGVPVGADLGEGELAALWENYIWGAHSGLFVGEFEPGPYPDIAVASSQRLLRTFTYRPGDGLQLARNPIEWPQPALRFIGVADLDGSGTDYALEATSEGISAWRLAPTARRVSALDTRLQPVEAFHVVDGGAVISGPWGFALLKRVDSDYVRVLHRGAPYSLRHPAVVEGGRIYLSAPDWSALTGMTLRFDPAAGLVTGIRGFHFLVGNFHEGTWIYDGTPHDLGAILRGGVLYFDSGFARMVQVGAVWDPYSRTLVIGS